MKECIGDAIRNAAMRFGVALDLWSKADRHPEPEKEPPTPPPVSKGIDALANASTAKAVEQLVGHGQGLYERGAWTDEDWESFQRAAESAHVRLSEQVPA